MSPPVTEAMSSATNGCVPAPSPGSRTDIGSGSPCSSDAGWSPGAAPGSRAPPLPPARLGVEPPAGADEIVGVLAAMALACVGGR